MAASPSSNSERFAIVSKEERDLLLKDAVPQLNPNSHCLFDTYFQRVLLFHRSFLQTRNFDEDTLSDVLERFYCGLRKKDGGEYKCSGYIAGGAIQRHLDSLERSIP